MNPTIMPSHPSMPRLSLGADGAVLNALSLLVGAGFTCCLFLGIAHFKQAAAEDPPSRFDDLKLVSIPLQPPPPPRTPPAAAESAVIPATVTGFEAAPSDSPVKIAVSPPDLDSLTSGPQPAPPAVIQIGQLYTDFKPSMDLSYDPQRVFQQNEVDQRPTVLFHRIPVIPKGIRGKAEYLRVTLLLVIDTVGAVGDVRVVVSSANPQFDAIIVENIKEWGFSPAIRKGRKVRCLVEQPVKVVWTSGSPFQVD
jgi:TonB family protein